MNVSIMIITGLTEYINTLILFLFYTSIVLSNQDILKNLWFLDINNEFDINIVYSV